MPPERFIVIFQHGPVQEFINTARKTEDLWAGSHLLGRISSMVIKELQEAFLAEIVYPYIPSESRNDFEGLPNRVATIVAPYGKLYRFVFETTANSKRLRTFLETLARKHLKRKLSKIKSKVNRYLVSFFKSVEQDLTSGTSKVKAPQQVEGTFETYFIFVPYEEADHASSFRKAETVMAARRAIRDFSHRGEGIEPGGRFCTLCGIRTALRIDSNKAKQFGYAFREGERLCSICAGKRLLKKAGVGWERPPCPSVNTVCVAAWLSQVKDEFDVRLLNEFREIVYELGKSPGVPKVSCATDFTPPPRPQGRNLSTYLDVDSGIADRSWIFTTEGDFWIPDSYLRLSKEAKDEEQKAIIYNAEKKLAELLASLPKDLQQPPKYYSIIRFDADDMGLHLMRCKSKDDHALISKRLFEFGVGVREICHERHYAYLVYFGGDEGIVISPLSEAIEIMKEIRDLFLGKMVHEGADSSGRISISQGVCMLHRQSPLSEGLMMAQAALKRAKGVEGKDGVGITVCLRSGHRSTCALRWEAEGISFDGFVKKWLEAYANEDCSLSPRWWYEFCKGDRKVTMEMEEEDPPNAFHSDLVQNLLHRIIPRHIRNASKAKELIEMSMKINNANRFTRFEELTALLHVPLFLYRH